jgi:glutathione reductase (NADPH)
MPLILLHSGVASSRWAASKLGVKAAVVEYQALGGTCVNVGCVPKKVMFNAASVLDSFHAAESMGVHNTEEVKFDWPTLKQNRDAYVKRLNGIYDNMLKNIGVYSYNF